MEKIMKAARKYNKMLYLCITDCDCWTTDMPLIRLKWEKNEGTEWSCHRWGDEWAQKYHSSALPQCLFNIWSTEVFILKIVGWFAGPGQPCFDLLMEFPHQLGCIVGPETRLKGLSSVKRSSNFPTNWRKLWFFFPFKQTVLKLTYKDVFYAPTKSTCKALKLGLPLFTHPQIQIILNADDDLGAASVGPIML